MVWYAHLVVAPCHDSLTNQHVVSKLTDWATLCLDEWQTSQHALAIFYSEVKNSCWTIAMLVVWYTWKLL